MGVDRYGVSYARDWGLLIIVGVACFALGGLTAYLATGRLAEKYAKGWRACEELADSKEKR